MCGAVTELGIAAEDDEVYSYPMTQYLLWFFHAQFTTLLIEAPGLQYKPRSQANVLCL